MGVRGGVWDRGGRGVCRGDGGYESYAGGPVPVELIDPALLPALPIPPPPPPIDTPIGNGSLEYSGLIIPQIRGEIRRPEDAHAGGVQAAADEAQGGGKPVERLALPFGGWERRRWRR